VHIPHSSRAACSAILNSAPCGRIFRHAGTDRLALGAAQRLDDRAAEGQHAGHVKQLRSALDIPLSLQDMAWIAPSRPQAEGAAGSDLTRTTVPATMAARPVTRNDTLGSFDDELLHVTGAMRSSSLAVGRFSRILDQCPGSGPGDRCHGCAAFVPDCGAAGRPRARA
jgi:hypothetical protein